MNKNIYSVELKSNLDWDFYDSMIVIADNKEEVKSEVNQTIMPYALKSYDEIKDSDITKIGISTQKNVLTSIVSASFNAG
jgi:hypothetical protein